MSQNLNAEAPQLDDLVLREGDEEVQYVVVEVDDKVAAELVEPGAPVVLKGLDTETPTVYIGGVELAGVYEDTVGTTLVLEKRPAHAAGDVAGTQQQQGRVAYKCLSEKKLVLKPTS